MVEGGERKNVFHLVPVRSFSFRAFYHNAIDSQTAILCVEFLSLIVRLIARPRMNWILFCSWNRLRSRHLTTD